MSSDDRDCWRISSTQPTIWSTSELERKFFWFGNIGPTAHALSIDIGWHFTNANIYSWKLNIDLINQIARNKLDALLNQKFNANFFQFLLASVCVRMSDTIRWTCETSEMKASYVLWLSHSMPSSINSFIISTCRPLPVVSYVAVSYCVVANLVADGQ